MWKILFSLSIVFCLFITTTTANYIGVSQVVMTAMTPLLIFIIIQFVRGKIIWGANYNKQAIILLIIGLFAIFFKFLLGQDYLKTYLCFLLIPMLSSLVFEHLSKEYRIIMMYILLTFFIIECSIAIYERLIMENLFPLNESIDFYREFEDWTFRSNSLLGHPLANGMAVCVMLSFILCSQLNIYYKVFLFFLGYISLFCFNARGATIVATILFFPYLYRILRKNLLKKRLFLYIVILLAIFMLYHILTTTSLGGRLLNSEKLIDGSAETRLDVWKFYEYIDIQSLLFGSPDSYVYIMNKLGAGGVENGLISIIIDSGLIITMLMIPYLIVFHWEKLKCYPMIERLMIFSVFYVVGMMNPNLKMPMQWMIWIFCYYTFRPIGKGINKI